MPDGGTVGGFCQQQAGLQGTVRVAGGEKREVDEIAGLGRFVRAPIRVGEEFLCHHAIQAEDRNAEEPGRRTFQVDARGRLYNDGWRPHDHCQEAAVSLVGLRPIFFRVNFPVPDRYFSRDCRLRRRYSELVGMCSRNLSRGVHI